MGNAISDHGGLRVIEEDSVVDVIRRQRAAEQEAKFKESKEVDPASPEDIRKYYGDQGTYDDLEDATAEFVERHAPEQVNEVPMMLRRYRGMEQKLYEALEDLYRDEPNFAVVDFDLDRLPFKGNMQHTSGHFEDVSAWVQRVSGKVITVQAKVRGFLAQRRARKFKQETKQQVVEVQRTDSQDIAMLERAAFPSPQVRTCASAWQSCTYTDRICISYYLC